MGPTKSISEASLDSEKGTRISKVGPLAQCSLVPCGKMVLKPPVWLLPNPGGSTVL